jgi:GTP-binding protein HflX
MVGYTNAGKSTILNHLLDQYGDGAPDEKKVLEKDMLLATLDTTVRKINAPGHRQFLLSDTVGFINDLPTTLVKAFRSTLDEIRYADLLIEVVDFSDPDHDVHIDVTDRTLAEIGAGDIPRIYVFNKCDQVTEGRGSMLEIPYSRDHRIYMAAGRDIGISELLSLIDSILSEGSSESELLIPYSRGDVLSQIMDRCEIISTEYEETGTRVCARMKKNDILRWQEYAAPGSL